MPIAMGKRVFESLNKQITEEFSAAYMFLAMSSVFFDMKLNGCAKWSRSQFEDKIRRSQIICDYIISRGVKPKLLPITTPKQDWRAPLHIFEEVMRLEQKMSNNFSALFELTISEKDFGSQVFVKDFIEAQIKNEVKATYLLDRIRKMQSTDIGVLMFDTELANTLPSS